MIDLNADLGEGAGTDEQLLEIITSASVACGGHAGDPAVMERTVALARARGVGIGAHPSFPDRDGFGRRAMKMSPLELRATLVEQMEALWAIARRQGAALQHVKPHGALYNLAVGDAALAAVIGDAVRAVDPALIIVTLAGSLMAEVLERVGLRVAREAFIDRGYTAAGTLVPRDKPGALLTDPATAGARAVRLARDRLVPTVDGPDIAVAADTFCVHGDTPNAAAVARAVRRALDGAGIPVARMETFV